MSWALILRTVLISTLLVVLLTPASRADDCDRWEVLGVRLGQTLSEAREALGKLKHVSAASDKWNHVYVWSASVEISSVSMLTGRTYKAKPKHLIATQGKEDDSPVISMQLQLSGFDRQPDVLQGLIDRWGQPELGVVWIDEECDVYGRFLATVVLWTVEDFFSSNIAPEPARSVYGIEFTGLTRWKSLTGSK